MFVNGTIEVKNNDKFVGVVGETNELWYATRVVAPVKFGLTILGIEVLCKKLT